MPWGRLGIFVRGGGGAVAGKEGGTVMESTKGWAIATPEVPAPKLAEKPQNALNTKVVRHKLPLDLIDLNF